MLVLTRNVGQVIRISDDIYISVLDKKNGSVRLGITAPKEITVYREDVYRRILLEREDAGDTSKILISKQP